LTVDEYIQLKAFARWDGLWLALLWVASFACYVLGLRTPGLGLVALVLVIVTPFFIGRQLKRFRDDALDGFISFKRGWAYVMFLFLYAGLLFAVAQFVYFSYMDHGFFVDAMTKMTHAPETSQALQQMGMVQTVDESLNLLRSMRPIDLTLNILTTNLLIGLVLGIPIALVVKRERIVKRQ